PAARPPTAGASAHGPSATNAPALHADAPPDPHTRTTTTPDPRTRTTPPDPLTRTTNTPDPSTTPPDPLTRTTDTPDPLTRDALLLPLSARSPEALRALAMAYHQRLAERPDLDPADLCRAAAVRRARLELRLAVTGATRDDLQDALSAFLQRELHPRCFASPARPGPAPRVTFVFSGHSGHWVGMGRELLARAPAFRAAFEACAAALQEHAPMPLVEHLLAADAETRWTRPEVLQPLVFAVQVALAALWRAWGVEPAAVVGHSAGEIAAAHVAGALSLADAARLCARRSELIGRAHGTGAMAVIALPLDRVRTALAGHEHQLGVAACNSPSSTVISGDPHALDLVLAQLARQNVFARVVRGATAAGHSPQMDAITPALTAALAGLTPRPATVPFYSTVTAALADGASLGPTYWAQNLRAPVLFAQTIAKLGHDGHDTFVEIGPHPLLLGAIEQTLRPRGGAITLAPSTRSGEPERLTMLTSLARLFAAGLPLDWTHLHPSPGPVLPLPTYPWQRQRHWIPQPRFTPAVDPTTATATASTSTPAPARTGPFDHHLASARNPGEHTFERTLPGPAGLALQDTELLPAALCTRLALAAGAAVGLTAPALAHVTLTTLELVGATTLQLSVSPDHTLEIHARTPAGWTRLAHGHLRQGSPAPDPTPTDLATLRARCPITQDGPTWYATLTDRGLAHAPTLRPIANLWRSDTEALAALTPTNTPIPAEPTTHNPLTLAITTPTAHSTTHNPL
ncbi:MAG: acyltransferase domain-containing protein, partial [Myxococcales bacterium]|nr:acyltransferase domain-containing protein [Myxococcales bacterium]